MTATSDNTANSGIDSITQFKHLVLRKHGDDDLRRMWQAVLDNELEEVNRLRKRLGKDPYDTVDAAVRGLVWKVCWYSHHDMAMIEQALRCSEFDAAIDYDASELETIRQEALAAQDELYQGY